MREHPCGRGGSRWYAGPGNDVNETITEDYLTFLHTQELKTISADYDVAHAI